ncbi:MAG: penicillin-binding protein 2, partial [Muribaculaceae bacterium]|nr:penicillin-binding protein 2 [Muribaculaceae bacterium]
MKNSYSRRKYIIGGFIALIVCIYIVRLFNLQVADDQYKENAISNAFLRRIIYPARGLIYARNGRLLVFN